MNTQEQAYIEGFVKRANEYGFNDEEAFEILKEAARKRMRNGKPFTTAGYNWIPGAIGGIGESAIGAAGAAADKVKETASSAVNKLREGAGELGEKLRGAAKNSKDKVKDKLKEIASKGSKELSKDKLKEIASKGLKELRRFRK